MMTMDQLDEPSRKGITETRTFVLGADHWTCHLLDNGMKVIPVEEFLGFLDEYWCLDPGEDEDFDAELEKLQRWVSGDEEVDAEKGERRELRSRLKCADDE